MTLKKQNPWKLLSVGLLGIIAIGLLTPVDAKPPSGQQDTNQFEAVFLAIDDLQTQITAVVGDLATETAARIAADSAEAGTRAAADTTLTNNLAAHVAADGDLDSSNEAQVLSASHGIVHLGTTAAGDGGGSVPCITITGNGGLCDSNDAVDDADADPTNELQTLMVTKRLGTEKTIAPGGFDVSVAECLAGEKVVGGGFDTTGSSNILDVNLLQNQAFDETWSIFLQHAGATATDLSFKAQALCAKITP